MMMPCCSQNPGSFPYTNTIAERIPATYAVIHAGDGNPHFQLPVVRLSTTTNHSIQHHLPQHRHHGVLLYQHAAALVCQPSIHHLQ